MKSEFFMGITYRYRKDFGAKETEIKKSDLAIDHYDEVEQLVISEPIYIRGGIQKGPLPVKLPLALKELVITGSKYDVTLMTLNLFPTNPELQVVLEHADLNTTFENISTVVLHDCVLPENHVELWKLNKHTCKIQNTTYFYTYTC